MTTQNSISVVKSEAQTLLKKLDQSQDDIAAIEALYSLCLFEKNRRALADIGVLSNLILGLKTKSPRVRAYIARTLQLFAQDGDEIAQQMKRLNICNTCLDICSKTNDEQVLVPVAGLLYWLAQDPTCKRELQDMEASIVISELNRKSKNPMLSRYLNFVTHALKVEVKSRVEILQEIRSGKTDVLKGAKARAEKFEITSPRNFKSLLRSQTPQNETEAPVAEEAQDTESETEKTDEA